MEKITAFTAIVGAIIAIGSLANAVWQYRRKVHLEIFRTYADKVPMRSSRLTFMKSGYVRSR